MKTTRYFTEQVLRKRPDIRVEWCARVVSNPVHSKQQEDGRMRFWGYIQEAENRALRVVTLEDRQTIHNAFFDRGFRQDKPS